MKNQFGINRPPTRRLKISFMRKICCGIAVLALFLAACGDKKASVTTPEEMTTRQFIESFPELSLPFNLEDTSVGKKAGDTATIPSLLVSRFIPDSVFAGEFGKKTKPEIFPIGRVSVKGDKAENYLLIKAITKTRQAAYILVYNSLDSFAAAMPLLDGRRAASTGYSASIDRRYTIAKTVLKRQPSGEILYTKEAFVFNPEGVFTLILTESNDVSLANRVIINPIDTFPATHKWAGDYRQDKKNFVSVRDGGSENEILAFIHFEKSGGDCVGELKGRFVFTSPNTARYSESGDPCVLELDFSGNTVTMKEERGCGVYRGIHCFFEGKYTRKKPSAKK